ncbi:MAG: thioesterase family protein [Motiliproteus sp.]
MNEATRILKTTSNANDGGETFLTPRLIRFSDVDPAGIAYYPRIHNIIHEAFEDLFEEYIGERYYHVLQKQHIGFPMVHTEIDFVSPLHFGDRAQVKVNCFKLGKSSIGLRYRIELNGRICVDARTTVVCISTKTMKSIALTDNWRECFKRIMAPL